MVDTIREFIRQMMPDAAESYEDHAGGLSRWLHKNKPTKIYLSHELFSRVSDEEGIPNRPDRFNLGRLVIIDGGHPDMLSDFVIDVHGHFPVGYDPYHYGLKNKQYC